MAAAPPHTDEYDDIEDDDVENDDIEEEPPVSSGRASKTSKRTLKEVVPEPDADIDDIEEADKDENEKRGSSETDFVGEDDFVGEADLVGVEADGVMGSGNSLGWWRVETIVVVV